MAKKLLVFDFDGVLVTGTNEGYIRCYIKAMRDSGAIDETQKDYARQKIIENWGSDYRTEIRSVVKDPILFEKTRKLYLSFLQTDLFLSTVKKAPHTDSALDFISKNGFVPTILSGSPKDHILRVMDYVNISPAQFMEIKSGCDYPKEHQKPSPVMLLDQMKKFKVTLKDTTYIGDAKQDILLAKAAMVTSVTVLTGIIDRKSAEKHKTDFIINDLNEIGDVLKCI
ncbi:MAG: HAD family hydrolase [Candidatus Aenigmarchaeota archaeon]|nr:HAD family hydrolase [Candidatus Aenigmarchaeota archaeon]